MIPGEISSEKIGKINRKKEKTLIIFNFIRTPEIRFNSIVHT
tara:strand:+ start:466 stop:591 length:126 start_codon:yes stop_codon:yes gene_type:complete